MDNEFPAKFPIQHQIMKNFCSITQPTTHSHTISVPVIHKVSSNEKIPLKNPSDISKFKNPIQTRGNSSPVTHQMSESTKNSHRMTFNIAKFPIQEQLNGFHQTRNNAKTLRKRRESFPKENSFNSVIISISVTKKWNFPLKNPQNDTQKRKN